MNNVIQLPKPPEPAKESLLEAYKDFLAKLIANNQQGEK